MTRAPQFEMLYALHKMSSPPPWRPGQGPPEKIVVPSFSVAEKRMFEPTRNDVELACELRNALPNLLELRKRLCIFASFGGEFHKAQREGAISEGAYRSLRDLMIAFGELEEHRSVP